MLSATLLPASVLVPSPRPASLRRPEPLEGLGLSDRDRRILALTRQKLGGPAAFAEVLRGLRESVAELIPAGRIYVLGAAASGPIVGSLISGVGLVDDPAGALLVRVERARRAGRAGRAGRCERLGTLWP